MTGKLQVKRVKCDWYIVSP